VKFLLELEGLELDQATDLGRTPLHAASENGHLECVKLLIEYGALINQLTTSGATPLVVAVQKANLKIVKVLIECGAMVD
jgi:ankyrin repeat protein